MQKINIIGEWAHHIFRDKDGNDVYTECPLDEYNKLALSNDFNPVPPDGMTWVGSGSGPRFDTPSGFPEKGTYWDEAGLKLVKPLDGDLKQADVQELQVIAEVEAQLAQEI